MFKEPLNQRVHFDPNNSQHLLDYAHFLKYNAWGKEGCPFFLEDDYDNIPAMLNEITLKHFMSKYMEKV